MSIRITNDEAGNLLDVSSRTVTSYKRARVLASAGDGVDMARLPKFLAERDGRPTLDLDGRNPIRETVEFLFDATLNYLGVTLAEESKRGGALAGLPPKMAARIYVLMATILTIYVKEGKFEAAVAKLGMGDLDDMCSFLTATDVHTKWREPLIPIPEAIHELIEKYGAK